MTDYQAEARKIMERLKAEALTRRAARAAARTPDWTAIYNAEPSTTARIAMLDLLPRGYALHENLSVGTIQPENRTMWRRPHLRFQVALEGKVIGEEAALLVIAARLRQADEQAA